MLKSLKSVDERFLLKPLCQSIGYGGAFVHSVNGKITVSGSIVGFVWRLYWRYGQICEFGQRLKGSSRGLKTASGTLKKAWGVADVELYDWFNNDTELDIAFDADQAGTHTYTLSGCVLTDFAIEGLEAGNEGALMINASFEALTWGRN